MNAGSMNLKIIWGLLKDTFNEWNEHKAPRLGAALAYYTLFSIAPLLIVVIAMAGLVFGQRAAEGQLVGEIRGLVGDEGAKLIQSMIENARQPASSIAATLIGLATLLLGALGVFAQLQDALNTIWGVAPKPGRGVLSIIQDRLLSFTMVLGTGFLLLVSLIISTALAALGKFFGQLMPIPPFILELINFVMSFAVITLLFALIFKYLPDAHTAWNDVWIGAAVTSLLFTIGKLLIGWYLGNNAVGSTYGAAGSLVVILLWIYYSAQILLFGAEFTQVYANRYGSRIIPHPDAISLSPTGHHVLELE